MFPSCQPMHVPVLRSPIRDDWPPSHVPGCSTLVRPTPSTPHDARHATARRADGARVTHRRRSPVLRELSWAGRAVGTARETPLSHSFYQFVVATGEPLVVEDARTVDFLQSNLAIRDLGVIAYAGVLLRLSTGDILGSFCAIERVPRAWTPAELESLQTLADAAMVELDLRETSRLLAERESQLRVLLDNSEELVCSFDAPGEIVYVNRAPAHVTGQRHSRGHDRRGPGHARPRRGAARRRRHSRRRHVGARDAVEDARDRTARCVDPRRGQRKGLDRATTPATPDLAP
jgi:GAF domain-containing protein